MILRAVFQMTLKQLKFFWENKKFNTGEKIKTIIYMHDFILNKSF